MIDLKGTILTLPKMSGSTKAQTINLGGNGATFIPSVSEDGIISWTNDRDLPNPDPVNIKGAPGTQGIPGKNGDDYVLTEADKEEIVNLVIEALPDGDGVAY